MVSGVHIYDELTGPVGVPPKSNDDPNDKSASLPASTVGKGATIIFTESLSVQVCSETTNTKS